MPIDSRFPPPCSGESDGAERRSLQLLIVDDDPVQRA